MKNKALIFLIIPLGLVADQLSKFWAAKHLIGKPISLIGDWFSFHYSENTGAAWGVLSDKTWLLALVSCIACILIALYYFLGKYHSKLTGFSLILIFTGALGNLLDRLFRGYVIDFINLNFFALFGGDFPIFNIADIFVTIGVALLIITLLFLEKEEASHE